MRTNVLAYLIPVALLAGCGGADPNGNGLSGLRSRVEALDGILVVRSNPGEGTTVHAELPCE